MALWIKTIIKGVGKYYFILFIVQRSRYFLLFSRIKSKWFLLRIFFITFTILVIAIWVWPAATEFSVPEKISMYKFIETNYYICIIIFIVLIFISNVLYIFLELI